MKKYYSGLIPSPPDPRDYRLGAYLPAEPVELPDLYQVPYISPVRDQLNFPACVGFAAVTGAKESQEMAQIAGNLQPPVAPVLSPLFLYQLCKFQDGAPDAEGTYIRLAFKILAATGVSTEACMPYVPRLGQTPCPEWKEQAAQFKIGEYAAVSPDIDEIKAAILKFGGVVAGVYTSYQWSRTKTGVIKMLKSEKYRTGGHAVWLCGWDARYIKFKNSWGAYWGNAGYGYLPYGYIEQEYIEGFAAVDA